jgi:CNT family concentrative nucleoside transporter
MAVLFHWGIIQRIVTGVSSLVQPILQTSGAETLCAIANSFLGQTESPLLIRNYIGSMTNSEIMLVMISGMGTISGAVLAVFAGMGIPAVHLLTASVMAIPATIVVAKILYPETETPETSGKAVVDKGVPSKNFFDAISLGASDGLQLALNVAAMLITFLSLIGLINNMLGFGITQMQHMFALVGIDMTLPELTLQSIFGYMFAPFGWLLGLRGDEIFQAGQLIGIKVAVNEMVAYTELIGMQLSDRAITLLTYVLCGFSNFSCIGIQIGGIGALEPSKRAVLGEMGFRAVFGAMLANLLSAFVVGLLL